ncbi:MAG: hypothetical protein ACP5I8_08070 [Phycisphaerae bacterium]
MLEQAARQSTDWSAIIGVGTAIFGLVVAASQARRALWHKRARLKTRRRLRLWRYRARHARMQAMFWKYMANQL